MTPSEARVGTSGTQAQMPCAQWRTSLTPMNARMAASPWPRWRSEPSAPSRTKYRARRPEQREGVRREHEVRVAGDAVDRRHRVDGEDDVGAEDGDGDEGERRQRAAAGLRHGQPGAGVLLGHREEAPEHLDRAQLPDVDGVVGSETASLPTLTAVSSRIAPKSRKVQRERRDHLRPEGDEDTAQDERAGDPMRRTRCLQLVGHRERGEQEHEDEEVVDRERLLDEVARVVLEPAVAAEPLPDEDTEGEREPDVERRPGDGLLHRDRVRLAGQDEVEGEQAEHDDDGGAPEQGRADGVGGAPGGAAAGREARRDMGGSSGHVERL